MKRLVFKALIVGVVVGVGVSAAAWISQGDEPARWVIRADEEILIRHEDPQTRTYVRAFGYDRGDTQLNEGVSRKVYTRGVDDRELDRLEEWVWFYDVETAVEPAGSYRFWASNHAEGAERVRVVPLVDGEPASEPSAESLRVLEAFAEFVDRSNSPWLPRGVARR